MRKHKNTPISSLQWRHNEHDGVSNHQCLDCLLNRLSRHRSKKTSKLRVTGLCAGNSPVTGEFPAHWNGQSRGKCFHLMTSSCSVLSLCYTMLSICDSNFISFPQLLASVHSALGCLFSQHNTTTRVTGARCGSRRCAFTSDGSCWNWNLIWVNIKIRLYLHYSDVIMSTMTSQITSVSIVYSTVCPGADQRKHQSSVPLAFVWGIHRWPMNSPHKKPVTRKCFNLMTSWSVLSLCYTMLSVCDSYLIWFP